MGELGAVSAGLVFTKRGMRALDAYAMGEVGVPGVVLMEHAAQAVAGVVVRERVGVSGLGVAALCGRGNNGGDALAACRLLHVMGVACRCLLVAEEGAFSGDAGVQLRATRGVGVEVRGWSGGGDLRGVGLVIDGVFGTGLSRAVEGAAREAIGVVNGWRASDSARRVVAVDVPSGMDADTGGVVGGEGGVCVRADVTVTLGGMKVGLAGGGARALAGRVEVGELGLPRDLLERFAEG